MKAWRCINYYDGYTTIVFAETAGKARYIAMQSDTIGDDIEFMDVIVWREKRLDAHYRGVSEMDWDNADDRIAIVQELGLSCDDDIFDPDDCKRCPAAEWCWKYHDWLEEEQETSE